MEHKIAFITGSSSGIGRSTVLRFAGAGYAVVVSYFNDEAAGVRVCEECRTVGAPDTLLVQIDVKDPQSVTKAVGEITAKFGHIDVLVNNAGVAVKSRLVEQDEETIQNQIATNLMGSILVTKCCLPSITSGIVFIGSKTALHGKGKMSVYSASKFGVRGFMESIALEYPNLYVCLVNPGSVATRLGGAGGESPDVVADVVFQSATGGYRVRSGGCVNVWEYRYGKVMRFGILFVSFLKQAAKKVLIIS